MSALRLLVLLPILACTGASAPFAGPIGLRADGVLGVLRPGGGCAGGPRIGLWGPRWGTDGEVPVEAVEESPGVVWLYFQLQTGLGVGDAALRLEGGRATLPLGAREGEHELRLSVGEPPGADELDRAAEAGALALEAERRAWGEGAFLLQDGEAVVGDLRFLEDRARVAVYDAFWLTPEPVSTAVGAEGSDLVLVFPVEPALEGELAQLRLSVPLGLAVVPAERVPTELDRRLELRPGALTEEARAAAMAEAGALADRIEAEQTGALARKLAREARTEDGACLGVDDLDPEWRLLFRGYQVRVSPSADGGRCEVEVAPLIAQHGRHLHARFGPETGP